MSGDDLAENYAVYDGHLTFGDKPALLIVDFAMAYLEPTSPLFADAEGALASNVRLLAAARAAGVPVIFTRVEYIPGGADGGLFYQKIPALCVFDAGSPLGEFPASLQPEVGEDVVTKRYASAFFATSLSAILKDRRINTLLITGMSTSGCVRATALDALQNGFAPFVISDACGDRHAVPHSASLFDLQAKYAEVISEEKAIGFLDRYIEPTS